MPVRACPFLIRPPLPRYACLAALLLALAGPAQGMDDAAAAQHAAALASARQGDLDGALVRLAQLLRRYPGEALFLHDTISLRQRAGRHADALDLLPRVDRQRAPAYVTEALGAAATALGRHALADELFLETLRRFPGRTESLQALADAVAARTLAREAVPANVPEVLTPLGPADRAEVLQRASSVLEARPDYYAALHLTLAALRAQPTHAAALAARVRLTARLGAAHLALQWAQATPGLVDGTQLDTLRRHVAAMDGRWSRALRSLPNRQRHGRALLDAALAPSDALAQRFHAGDAALSENDQRWLHDRLVLLGLRGRAGDVDTLYRDFLRAGLPLPAYALSAVAAAQLSLRQPRNAAALYERVLAQLPDDEDARVGMYYALLESGQHARASAWADDWASRTAPPAGSTPGPASRATHWGARNLQARAHLYAGDPASSQAALEVLREEVPASPEVRAGLAAAFHARGWPRRAWETLQIQLLHDPEDVDAYADSVAPLLNTQRFALARQQLQAAARREPEALSVRRAARAWHLHERPELVLSANSGRSRDAATPSGDRDQSVDAALYSPPLYERYRAYLHAAWRKGRLPAGSTRYRRAGAGLEYRAPDLRLTGEWHAGWRNDGGGGVRLGAKWWIDDVWNVSLDGDTRTADVPLQARVAGIDARRAVIEAEARLHESRSFAVAASVMDFSDGNGRQSALLSWRERWLTRPRFWLDSRADLYASQNSRDDAPYFNPSADFAAGGSLTGAWRTWQWYERALTQELTLSAGRYWQRSYAAGPTWGIEYAHRWELDERFYLRYAAGRTLHPYDGQQSGRSYLTLDLDWRF